MSNYHRIICTTCGGATDEDAETVNRGGQVLADVVRHARTLAALPFDYHGVTGKETYAQVGDWIAFAIEHVEHNGLVVMDEYGSQVYPELDIRIISETINAEPRKLNMTIDTRARCGWLQMFSSGIQVWPCEALSGDLEADGWDSELVGPEGRGQWGMQSCPEHREGGPEREWAALGLRKLTRAADPALNQPCPRCKEPVTVARESSPYSKWTWGVSCEPCFVTYTGADTEANAELKAREGWD